MTAKPGISTSRTASRTASRAAWRARLRIGLAAVLAVPFLYPLVWMAATALKPTAQVYAQPLSLLPNPPTLANFAVAWGLLDFTLFLRNTLWVTGWSVLGALLSSSLVGFGFATIPVRANRPLFALLLATVMIPPSVTLIPQFILFSQVGWTNSYLPLIVPSFFANPFYVFLFRQFFRGLPAGLFESAELDGCNPLQAYWYLALPLSKPVVATTAIFAFVAGWNDFLQPLVYLSTSSKFTLSVGLSLFQGLYYTQLEYLMPLSLLALLPVLLLFVLLQRLFVQGIATSGLHG